MWKIISTGVTGMAGKFFTWRQAKTEAERSVKLARLNNSARLLQGEQTHNSEMEMKQLDVASPWMRRLIAFHILVLIDIAVVAPEYAKKIFEALEEVPVWVIGLFVTVFGFYFAVKKLSELGTAMIAKKFTE